MRQLLFIRHAESEANRNRILASRLPSPLTAAGLEDARRIAGELRTRLSLERIISSPLRRAVETAQCFAVAYNLPLETDDRLAEQDLGPFSAKSYDEVKLMEGYETNPLARWNWNPGGTGESYAAVADRVIDFLSSIEEWSGNPKTLIVTHAVVFRVLRGALENTLPIYPEKFPNNGEIWDVDFRGLGTPSPIESILLGNSRLFNHNP